MEAISGDVLAMLGTPGDESSALDSKAMNAVDVRHVVRRPNVSKVASHGIVATSLIRGDGPSVGVMCGGPVLSVKRRAAPRGNKGPADPIPRPPDVPPAR